MTNKHTSQSGMKPEEAERILFDSDWYKTILNKEDVETVENKVKPSKILIRSLYSFAAVVAGTLAVNTIDWGYDTYQLWSINKKLTVLDNSFDSLYSYSNIADVPDKDTKREQIYAKKDSLEKEKSSIQTDRFSLAVRMLANILCMIAVIRLRNTYTKYIGVKRHELAVHIYQQKYMTQENVK